MGQHKTWSDRRDQLIRATIELIHENGLEKTTTQGVANRAGLTAGVVAHYFGDKDGLLSATFEKLYADILNEDGKVTARAPLESQIKSILLAYLSADQFSPEVISAWYELVARSRQSPELMRILLRSEMQSRSRLMSLLERRLPEAEARILASGLHAMVTGFWVQLASQPETDKLEDHRSNIVTVVDRFLEAFSVVER